MRRLTLFIAAVFGLAAGCECAQLDPRAGYLCDPSAGCREGQLCDLEGRCLPESDGGGGGSGGGSGGSGGSGGGGGGAGVPTTISLRLSNDKDDATWCNAGDEELQVVGWIEVGTDGTQCRAGIRFTPGLPRGATVLDARLRFRIVGGASQRTNVMVVQVYDSVAVPSFSSNHQHPPEAHSDGGFRKSIAVGGWMLDAGLNGVTTSPNLKALVQAMVDRPDWDGASTLGFVLEPATAGANGWYVGLGDSSRDAGGELTITYQ